MKVTGKLTDCQNGGKNLCWFYAVTLLPVTVAVYRLYQLWQNGEDKPAMRWSFKMGTGGESDEKFFDFIIRLEKDLVSVIDAAS